VTAEREGQPAAALLALDQVTRRLRRECPWDREQDERSIVPHTVEEAYELADAAHSGDDAKLLDELGDVLFQVYFLSLLLEERGGGDLAAVAEHCHAKLVRRHPHVFAEGEARDSAAVRRRWDEIKRVEEGRSGGIFGDLPETLPGPLYARKILRRASEAPVPRPDPDEQVRRLRLAETDEQRFEAAGALLLAGVAEAHAAGVDPELALRAAARDFGRQAEEAVAI